MCSGVQHHSDQWSQDFQITEKDVKDEELLGVVGGPHESGQGRCQRMEIL